MMDINDVKKLIDNVAQKPLLCSNTEITTDNGYVITTKEHYEKLRKHRLCQARGREAIFHRWTELATVVEPSPLVGGHPGGQTNITLAIVEYKKRKSRTGISRRNKIHGHTGILARSRKIISFKEGRYAKRETAEQKEI